MQLFSNLLFVGECLLDDERVKIFEEAIKEKVNRGDIVVDAGTGTGILSLLAAKYGAKKVYSIESSPELAEIAKKNVTQNNLSEIIEVIVDDVRNIKLEKRPVDVLIMEMLDTGLVAEHQAEGIIALRENGVIGSETKMIPGSINSAVTLIDYDFYFSGFELPFIIQARNSGVVKRVRQYFSQREIYHQLNFSEIKSTSVEKIIQLVITKSGLVNALLMETQTFFGKESIWGTTDMNMPVIIPIKSREVSKGDLLKIKIHYEMSRGFSNLSVNYL